jgi:hypothetical protein
MPPATLNPLAPSESSGRPNLNVSTSALQSLFAIAALSALVVVLWFGAVAPGHHWGDDWAAYLMQAQALQDGRVVQELALNTVAMDGGDTQVGPYAYPWGYPLLLAATGLLAGWDLASLKVLGLVSMLVLLVATYALARSMLRPPIAAAMTVFAALQPYMLVDMVYLSSDLPFTALSGVALWCMFVQWQRIESGRALSLGLAAAIALLCAFAFSVRSNGVVLPTTYVAMLGVLALRGARSVTDLALHGLQFVALAALLFAVALFALPDGSLVHASYARFDPALWISRLRDHVDGLWSLFPFTQFREFWKLIPLGLMLLLLVRGIVRWPWESAVLCAYAAMHLLLLTLVPFQGGVRYYLPLLAPACLMIGFGWQAALDDARARQQVALAAAPRPANGLRALAALLPAAALAAFCSVSAADERELVGIAAPDAPYGHAMQETIRWIAERAPADAQVGFSKPRAFRFMTGRTAYVITQPQNLPRVDWYITNELMEPRLQVPESALLAPETGFQIAYRNGPFKVFVRGGSAGKRPAAAARPNAAGRAT